MNSTIGNHYDNALSAINTPGSEFYVAPAAPSMSCDTVAQNISLLTAYINTWNQRTIDAVKQFIPSQATINNCKAIVAILRSKLDGYTPLQSACDVLNTGGGTTEPTATPGTTPATSKSNILPLLALAVGGYFLYKRSHKPKRKR